MSVSRQDLARLKKLLLARDIDLVTQGVEFVVALGDDELWETLLRGVTYASEKNAQGMYIRGAFAPNPMFTGTRPAQVFHDLALVMLVANSPYEALKEEVTALLIKTSSGTYRDPRAARLPLEGIENFPKLEYLSLLLPQDPVDLSPLGRAPALVSLVLQGDSPLSLDGLGNCRTLTSLSIRAPIETTAGIEGTSVETLHVSSRMLRDLRGVERTKLRTLSVEQSNDLDISALARCVHLETAVLHTYGPIHVAGLGGCPVSTLRIMGQLAEPLPTLPKLASMIAPMPLRSAPQPALTSLVLSGQSAGSSPIAAAFPALVRLELVRAEGSLDLLRDAVSLETLILKQCNLTDTSALGSLTSLQQLGISRIRCVHLDSLPEALLTDEDCKPINELDLSFSEIVSIRAVGALKGLQILNLNSCSKLTSIEGVEGSDIRAIDLRGCSALEDVSALGELAELRLAALRGTAFHEQNVPESAAATVSLAQTVSLSHAARQAKPAAGKRKITLPVPKAQREAWEALQPLLAVVDAKGAARLLDWLSVNGTEEIYDVLLKGVSVTEREFTVRGRLISANHNLRDYLVQRIVGVGIGKEADRIAEARVHWQTRGLQSTDLRGIRRFQKLTHLQLHADEAIAGIDEISELPKLAHLTMDGALSLDTLGPLPALTEFISWRSQSTRADFVRHAPKLRELTLMGAGLQDLSGLTGHRTLRKLTFSDLKAVRDLTPLATLPALTELHLGLCPPLPSLKALTALQTLTVSPSGWGDLSCLAMAPARTLHIAPTQPLRLHGLAQMPNLDALDLGAGVSGLDGLPKRLTKLTLRNHSDLSSTPEMALDTLYLDSADDLSFTARIKGLRVLSLDPSYGQSIPDLSPLMAALSLEELHLDPNGPTPIGVLRGHPTLARIISPQWRRSYLQAPDDMLPLLV